MTYRGHATRSGGGDGPAETAANPSIRPSIISGSPWRSKTGRGEYDWLNRIIALGTGRRPPEGPVCTNVFEVL